MARAHLVWTLREKEDRVKFLWDELVLIRSSFDLDSAISGVDVLGEEVRKI
jgi:hypothetical protein